MNKYLRQLEIFNPDLFKVYGVNIVGYGAIGSGLGVLLSKLGIKRFILWDSDNIETHNEPNQFFMQGWRGNNKAYALKDMIQYFDKTATTIIMQRKLSDNCELAYPIVFACTDSISSRKLIYQQALESECKLLIDGRMAGKVFRVFTVDLTNKKACARYEKTFHKDTRQSCTNRSVIFNVFGVTSIMANQLVKVLQNKPYHFEVNFCYENLLLKISK